MHKKVNDYDYLLVGAGLFNAIFAKEASKDNKRCLTIKKRSHIYGNLCSENIENINVYSHIFYRSDVYIGDDMCPLRKKRTQDEVLSKIECLQEIIIPPIYKNKLCF